jgi:hypothetical protein
MSWRKALVITVASTLLGAIAPPASAGVFTGTCVLNFSFEFGTPVRSVTSLTAAGPSAPEALMTYDVTAYTGADLNPLKAGSQSCAMDVEPLDPFRETAAFGSGDALSWTCEEAAGTGSWHQDFYPDPDSVDGAHVLTGTWDNWVMVVNNPTLSFTGTINLTVAPADVGKLAQCETNGISSLRMIGVMHLQDPEV